MLHGWLVLAESLARLSTSCKLATATFEPCAGLAASEKERHRISLSSCGGGNSSPLNGVGCFSRQLPQAPSRHSTPDCSAGEFLCFVSGSASAILGLSFPAASRAGVFRGPRMLPGSTLPPVLCSTLGFLVLPELEFYFSIFPFPLREKMKPSVRPSHHLQSVFMGKNFRSAFS